MQRQVERVFTIWGSVLVVWALYRAFIQAPDWITDLIAKPLVFVLPVVLYVFYHEHRLLSSIGAALGHFKRDLGIGMGIGVLFTVEGVLANSVKYGKLSLVPQILLNPGNLVLMLATSVVAAFAEELLVRGFFYLRLKEAYKSEIKALVVSASMYGMLLVPTIFMVTRLNGVILLIFVMTNLVMSVANTMIFNETKTLTIPTLIHAFWNLAVVLYL